MLYISDYAVRLDFSTSGSKSTDEKSDFCSDSLNQVRARKSSAMTAWRRTPPC